MILLHNNTIKSISNTAYKYIECSSIVIHIVFFETTLTNFQNFISLNFPGQVLSSLFVG